MLQRAERAMGILDAFISRSSARDLVYDRRWSEQSAEGEDVREGVWERWDEGERLSEGENFREGVWERWDKGERLSEGEIVREGVWERWDASVARTTGASV